MATVYVTMEVMEQLAHRLAVSFFEEYNEPLPDFSQHDEALLDSALSLPRATFGRKELYPTLAGKAAIMFYSIIKNHAFSNGNKRIATATLLVFLYLNGKWIASEQKAIYRWAIRIAKSEASNRDAIVDEMTTWLEGRITTKQKKSSSGTDLFSRIWSVLGWLVPRFWGRRRSG